MFVWLLLLRAGGKPGFGPAAELLFFASPKKSNQKKRRATSVPLRGSLRYSQRSGHLQTRFAQTMQVPSSERCSVAQHGLMAGGYHTARPLRELRPNGLLASLTSRSAGVASFLTPHFSQGHGTPCHYAPPHSSLLTPTTSPLTPHSSLLRPPPRSRKVSNPPATPHTAIRAMPSSDCASGICPKASQPPRMPRPICKYI